MVKRFRWTRRTYRKAHQLVRLLPRMRDFTSLGTPALVDRYFELWRRHPQFEDRLLEPGRIKRLLAYKRGDDIPF